MTCSILIQTFTEHLEVDKNVTIKTYNPYIVQPCCRETWKGWNWGFLRTTVPVMSLRWYKNVHFCNILIKRKPFTLSWILQCHPVSLCIKCVWVCVFHSICWRLGGLLKGRWLVSLSQGEWRLLRCVSATRVLYVYACVCLCWGSGKNKTSRYLGAFLRFKIFSFSDELT